MTALQPFRLDGRVAFISGSRGHLGTAMTRALCAAGAHVILTAREYDGAARPLRLRCGARMREVEGGATIDGESILADIDAFGEREFRVRF